MRKIATLCALVCVLGFGATPASAIFSLGIHGGMDFNDQDGKILNELLSDGSTMLSLESEEIDAPLMGGVHILFDIMPMIDVELGLDVSFAKYSVIYSTSGGPVVVSFDEEAYFGRASAYVSGKYNLIKMPLFSAYGGAGLGYHFVAPLASKDLIDELIVEEGLSGDELSPEEFIDFETTLGFHLLGGLRMKPPIFPFGLTLEGRYFLTAENDYGDDTNNVFTFALGLEFGI
jgi:hypothetical protein